MLDEKPRRPFEIERQIAGLRRPTATKLDAEILAHLRRARALDPLEACFSLDPDRRPSARCLCKAFLRLLRLPEELADTAEEIGPVEGSLTAPSIQVVSNSDFKN